MWHLLFMFSAVPIAVALVLRWWFGIRVLLTDGMRPCHCDLAKWMPPPGDTAVVHRAEESADEFGRQLRLKALAEWREREPRAAESREKSRRFGMAVPPLSGVVAVLALVKGQVIVAISLFLGATVLAAVLGQLALIAELSAITQAARRLRETKGFPRRDDEEAVVRCALAHAWKESLPPILAMFQK